MLHRPDCSQSYGITCKKIRCIPLQRCDKLRGAFRAQCSNFSFNKFVWIDETGSDARSHARKYGYALRGLTRGKESIPLASELTTNTVRRDKFYDFIRGTSIPQMMPFNGSNLDNRYQAELYYLPTVQILFEKTWLFTTIDSKATFHAITAEHGLLTLDIIPVLNNWNI